MKSYEEVLDIINNARRFGNAPGVEVSREVLKALGHPDMGIPFIHVAGTNGKGSTCTFLESLAIAAGFRVGKFTSPHLTHFEERITVDRKEIPREDVTRLGNALLDREFPLPLTMFDYTLAMAVLYFKEQGVNLMILETGLGGRLDSTRALHDDPIACVITRIGFDHMAILGDTLAQIALEKAGIIRPGVPLFVAPQEAEAMEAIETEFMSVNSDHIRQALEELDKKGEAGFADFDAEGLAESLDHLYKVSKENLSEAEKLPLAMMGSYQAENAATALLTARNTFLRDRDYGLLLSKKETEDAMCTARWPGRMEILSRDPFLLADGAHNSNGVRALAESLQKLYPGERFHFVMGVMADKDYPEMIKALLPLAKDFVTVTPESSRALQGEELAGIIRGMGVAASYEPDVRAHFKKVLSGTAQNADKGRTVAFGSLYFIGELKCYI